jgi:hypothetical protein
LPESNGNSIAPQYGAHILESMGCDLEKLPMSGPALADINSCSMLGCAPDRALRFDLRL